MKALLMRSHGDLSGLALDEVPRPTLPDPHHVLVRVKAAALNHLDLWTREGLPGVALQLPHVLRSDGAGPVEWVGSAVQRVQPGDRVLINPARACYRC